VQAETPGLRRLQRLMDATFWPKLAGGCHLSRDTLASIQAAGFTIETLEQFRFPDGCMWDPTSPHLIGTASRS